MDIGSAIVAVSDGLKAAKAWRDVEKAFEAATFRAQLADVIEALTDAKLSLAEAKEALAGRDAEISRLTATINDRSELKVGEGGEGVRLFV
jgi:hypothetical protein